MDWGVVATVSGDVRAAGVATGGADGLASGAMQTGVRSLGWPVLRVNIHQAGTDLSRMLKEVEKGEEVLIARVGVPVARVVPWQPPVQPVMAPGAMRGRIERAGVFEAPLEGLFEALR